MRPGHPLATSASLRLGDCRPYPLVVADASTAIRPHLEAMAARENLPLDPTIETNSIEVMRHATVASDAVTFLTPIDILDERRAGNLVHVPLRTASGAPQQFVAITRDRAVNPLALRMLEHIGATLADDRVNPEPAPAFVP